MPRRKFLLALTAALILGVGVALLIRHYVMNQRASEIRYASGEVVRVGDRVDDNGQVAVVDEVLLASEPVELVGKDGVMKTTRQPGLMLKWEVGLTVFRPTTSERWRGIKFKSRAGGS